MTRSVHATIHSVNIGSSHDLIIGDEMVATGIVVRRCTAFNSAPASSSEI